VGAVIVSILAFGESSLLLLIAIGSWITLQEYWRLAGIDHRRSDFYLARLGELATIVLLFATWSYRWGALEMLLAVFLPLLFVVQLIARVRGDTTYLRKVAIVALGVIYIGGFLSFIFKLRNLQIHLEDIGALEFSRALFKAPDMIHFTLFPVLAAWCCDTAAYFSGKYFGRTKLAPSISPGKTITGLVGGMVGSATGVTLYAWLIGLVGQVQVYELIAFGVLAAALSQLGDLTVSAIKREAQMKDAGRILGAHGGMLDRIDGFLFALPATYIFFLFVLGR